MTRAFAVLLLVAGILGTKKFDNRNWEMFSAIGLPEGMEVPVYFLRVTPQLVGFSKAEMNDLRIVDGHGMEVPYIVRKMEGKEQIQRYFLEPAGSEPNNPLVYTAKVEGVKAPVINRIKLICSGFFVGIMVVSVSRDGVNWQESYRGKVYRTPLKRPDGSPVEQLSAVFPETEALFVRAELENESKWSEWTRGNVSEEPPILLGVAADYIERTLPVYTTLQFLLARNEDTENGGKILDLTFPQEATADHLEISIAETELDIEYRLHALWLQSTGESKLGKLLASGKLERVEGIPNNPFVIPLPHGRLPRGMRLILAPRVPTSLTVTYLAVKAIETRILFAGGRPKPYHVYLGNPRAKAPKYEESDLTELLKYPPEEATVLGMFAPNPDYSPMYTSIFSFLSSRTLLIIAISIALVGIFLLWKRKVSPATQEMVDNSQGKIR